MEKLKIEEVQSPRHHLHHSHAHEEDIPGTVNLQTAEGDDSVLGQALFPVPAQDPNDPLQWSNSKKTLILVVCCLYSFLGNAALTGISPYIAVFSAVFGVTQTEASNLITYPNLTFGFGSLFLVPLYLKFGRRPVMLGSMLCFIGGLIGASQAATFGGLMAARCIHSLGAGVCEALPIQLVNDIFFLHERGKRIAYYTAALSVATITPLPAGYMLLAGYSFHLYFYVVLAFSIALLALAFFVVEETSYDRPAALASEAAILRRAAVAGAVADPHGRSVETVTGETWRGYSSQADTAHGSIMSRETREAAAVPARRSFVDTLSVLGRVDRSVSFFGTIVRSFTYFLVPQVLWVITTFGITIGLGAFAVGFTFPLIIVQPPYNWSLASSGLQALGPTLGYILAIPFSSTSDRLAAYLTRRNNNIREAEMRLGVLLIPMLVGPAGLLLYGITAQRGLHWIGFFFGSGMMAWASFFNFSFCVAYAVDSYFANTSEMLIAMNLGKQAVSFGFGFKVVDWVMELGYEVVLSGIFTGVLLANSLVVIVFMVWGKTIRRVMSRSWLAKMHRADPGQLMTH